MTEVDVVLPEGVAEPTTKLLAKGAETATAAETTATNDDDTNSNEDKQQNEEQIKSNKELEKDQPDQTKPDKEQEQEDDAIIAAKLPLDSNSNSNNSSSNSNDDSKAKPTEESMDADDTEEGDSQITSSSSTENGSSKEPKPDDEDEAEEEEVTTNGDHEDVEDDQEKIGSTAENSCDAEDPLGAATQPSTVEQDEEEEEEILTDEKKSIEDLDEAEEEEEGSQESATAKTVTDSEPEAEEAVEAMQTEDDEVDEKKETSVNGFDQSPKAAEAAVAPAPKAKPNGQASTAETTRSNKSVDDDDAGAVVNLDEDSDEEMPEMTEKKASPAENPLALSVNKVNPKPVATTTSASSEAESSDDAVLIASDSESETGQVAPPPSKKQSIVKATPPPPPPPQDDDDDDDDCVVIEDDTPPNSSPSDHAINKRKSDMDELQSNSKRQRSSTPSSMGMGSGVGIGLGQLTIKDARSLMPHETGPTAGAVYPVTITNAVTGVATNLGNAPPKLVPMSGVTGNTVQLNPPTLSLTAAGLPSMTNNANLLPGLTDDMFVLEAPSFIVPYIYEKPPNDNIREVVKAIETKYALSPEDLAVADKVDEFDMMTEQNKEDKPNDGEANPNANAQSKKKKKRGDDESWSEQSDEDDDEDDDDDSESGVRTKVLIKEANDDLTALKGAIKPASALAASGGVPSTTVSKPGQENYFESPLGKFFMDIGVGLVQEYVQADLLRLQKRKMRKSLSRDPKDFEMAINALSGNLQASKTKNAPFKFTMKRCEFCNFKSESALSMANHYETPHMNGVLYKCNFCTFEIRNATEIVYHMEAVHNIKARLIKPLPYHQCPNCGFEDNGKAKLARHQPVCAKKFRPELNLAPPNDWEAPAKIPRIKPRHGLVGTATAYQAMAAQAAAQKAALATIQQQQAAAQARNMQAAALAAQNAAKMRQRAPQLPKAMPNANSLVRNSVAVRGAIGANAAMSLPNSYQLAAGQLVQQASKKPIAGQPSISITPLPRQSAAGSGASAASSSKMPTAAAAGMKPGQSPTAGNNKAQFVICEICDGYIKDLEQLRNHMQWMHKVKIHPKMIYNRPPLNCQKCQFRFFTDQGLERHLLGSHGLVTSSMQEAANKGKDAGRCPVCGRMYQWKLLNHVSRDHHMTLKPAHLSYKCTVCTATFGMYKQFETHVYTAHSTVARKAMDSKKNSAQSSSSSSSGMNRNSLGAANDSLLKPLKINDEITIIPQPASKPRITNMESHVID